MARPATKKVDWERVEADYRAGLKTLLEIANEHEISQPYIRKRAKRDGWDRDLSKRISARVGAIVRTSSLTAGKEAEIIDNHAQMLAAVELDHMAGCRKLRGIFNDMLRDFDEEYRERTVLQRVPVVDKLVSTQDKLYATERKVLKLDQEDTTNKDQATKSVEVKFV